MTNYSRGRAREYKTMQLLRDQGYVCSRSAMSHGPVDVFAAKSGRILLIQVKSGKARAKKEEIELLKRWALAFDAVAQIWSFKKRGGLVKVTVQTGMRIKRTRKVKKKSEQRIAISSGSTNNKSFEGDPSEPEGVRHVTVSSEDLHVSDDDVVPQIAVR